MSGLALGLDGGGTQVRVQVAALDGAVMGEGTAGACNIAIVPPLEAVTAAWTAAQAALTAAGGQAGDVRAVCAGVAGVSFVARRDEFQSGLQTLFPKAQVVVEPDYAIALSGATGGAPGVLVIAGTGSVAYGEDGRGQSHKAGAYGYLVDDAGSGYGVGRGALAAVMRAADGTGPPTRLTGLVLGALGLASVADIVAGIYGGGISRVAIASLSRAVAEAAGEDDAVARALLMRAGGALAQLARAVTESSFPATAEPFPVAFVGGLWNAGPPLTDVFSRSLQRFATHAVITPARYSPVHGAVQRALKLLAR